MEMYLYQRCSSIRRNRNVQNQNKCSQLVFSLITLHNQYTHNIDNATIDIVWNECCQEESQKQPKLTYMEKMISALNNSIWWFLLRHYEELWIKLYRRR